MNEAKSPQQIRQELSRRIDSLMSELFPAAKREAGGKYSMGNFSGDRGYSTSVFKNRNNSVYLAKDHESDESINILELVHRVLGGSFSETMRWAHKFCGYEQIRTIKVDLPKIIEVTDEPLRGTEVARYMLQERKLNERTLNLFKVFQSVRNGATWWGAPYYDEDNHCRMMKYTNLARTGNRKQIYSTQPVFSAPFGSHLVTENDTSVIICEGEIDAMSIFQIQKDDKIPVISVPSASNHNWIEHCYSTLSQMETIYIASDMDDAGQNMFIVLSKRLGVERCKRLEIPRPHNDVNEWFCKDNPTEEQLLKLLDESKTTQSESLVRPSSFVLQMQDCVTRQEQEKEFKNWMFQDMDLSLRPGELFTICGIPGSGKSQLAYQFANFLADNGTKLMFLSFEIPIEAMMLQLAHQKLGRESKHEECAEIAEILGEHMYFVDDTLFRHNKTWEGLRDEIVLAKKKYGIGVVFIDSYAYLAPKMDFENQGIISMDLARTGIKNEVSIVLLAHADAKSKDSGGTRYPPTSPGNILGAQELSQASHTICSMWRNVEKEMAMSSDSQDRKEKFAKQGDAIFSVFKQRNSGANFSKDLWFNKETRMFQTTPIEIDVSPVKGAWYLDENTK
jgi:twinkle protein